MESRRGSKAHSGKTSDRPPKSMSGTVSYFLGKQEGEFSLRDQVLGSTYLMCSPWCVSHDQETYCKWLASSRFGSVFTLILPLACLAPLAGMGIRPQGWPGQCHDTEHAWARLCHFCQSPVSSPAPAGKPAVWIGLVSGFPNLTSLRCPLTREAIAFL